MQSVIAILNSDCAKLPGTFFANSDWEGCQLMI